jgi:hypothetical protein
MAEKKKLMCSPARTTFLKELTHLQEMLALLKFGPTILAIAKKSELYKTRQS